MFPSPKCISPWTNCQLVADIEMYIYFSVFSFEDQRNLHRRHFSCVQSIVVAVLAEVWNVDPGDCLQVLQGHAKAVNSAAFSPDDQLQPG